MRPAGFGTGRPPVHFVPFLNGKRLLTTQAFLIAARRQKERDQLIVACQTSLAETADVPNTTRPPDVKCASTAASVCSGELRL